MDKKDKKIGERIRQARAIKNISQRELGNHLELTKQAIYNIEKGIRKVSASELQEIARITDKPLTFFHEEEEPNISFNHRNPINKYSDLKDENKKFVDKLIETLKKMENEP